MSRRIQFNVRLDKYPDLYKAIKTQAELQGLSLNDFAIRVFHQALGREIEHPSRVPILRAELEEKLAEVLAPIRKQLEELEKRLGEPQA